MSVKSFFEGGSKSTAVAGESRGARQQAELPWVEKYRPKTVNDVSHQDEVVRTLSKSIETGNLPHLLFYGPPGTGKTSTILAIARQLYGPQVFRRRILELNASDERGINVVRTKIKTFSQVMASSEVVPGHPCPPYKLVVLDEADSMTPDAQAALRRTMETYSSSTRFCLICNYVTRIIEPLASRCAKFRFRLLPEEAMRGRLDHIAQAEGFRCSDAVKQQLTLVSGGDMRRAITLLQSAFRLEGAELSVDTITEISGRVPDEAIDAFLTACKTNQFAAVQRATADLVCEAYAASQFIEQLVDRIVADTTINDVQKAEIALALGDRKSVV